MNLYLLRQDSNRGYETYDSCVVAAENEDQARCVHPGRNDVRGDVERDCWLEYTWLDQSTGEGGKAWGTMDCTYSGWASAPSRVSVQLLGKAVDSTPAGVICASFNAG